MTGVAYKPAAVRGVLPFMMVVTENLLLLLLLLLLRLLRLLLQAGACE